MKIGIISDSHGRSDCLLEALVILIGRGAGALVHCGDVGSADCMSALGVAMLCRREGHTEEISAWSVAGNMDKDIAKIARRAAEVGVIFEIGSVEVPLGDGRYLAATHGHYEDLLDELITGGQYPYVCHGHTHRIRDEQVGDARVICPGALSSPRSPAHPCVAMLDTTRDELEFIRVK